MNFEPCKFGDRLICTLCGSHISDSPSCNPAERVIEAMKKSPELQAIQAELEKRLEQQRQLTLGPEFE